ncbi:MAG: nucleotidyltransferase family protein [Bacteroidales bacterium]
MIPAVILAAGASSRMGRPKALLPVGDAGEVFVTRLAATLLEGGAEDVVVVAGADAAAIRARLNEAPRLVRIIENPEWELGQLSSLRHALAAVERPGVRAVMAIPVDMPLVAAKTVRALREAYMGGEWLVVRPARGARHGHPVIFDRALFDELRTGDPGGGARAVVASHRGRVLDLELDEDDAGAFIDIDTPEDYERYIRTTL